VSSGNGVRVITPLGTDIFFGGGFSQAGGQPVVNIAKWSTIDSTWSSYPSGLLGTIYALKASGNNLYAGGSISAVNNIGLWSASSSTWSPLGLGTETDVLSLEIHGTDVYVGGSFRNASRSNIKFIARYSTVNSTWLTFAQGLSDVNGFIYSMLVMGDDLYVGGTLAQAGGLPAGRIAKWSTALEEGTTGTSGTTGTTQDTTGTTGTSRTTGTTFQLVQLVPVTLLEPQEQQKPPQETLLLQQGSQLKHQKIFKMSISHRMYLEPLLL